MRAKKIDRNLAKLTIGLFWRHALRYPRLLWPLLALVPITVLLGEFLAPYITSEILGRLSKGQFNPDNLWASFGPQLVLFAVIMMLWGVVLWRINIWIIWRLNLYVSRNLSQQVYNHLLDMSPNFHANRFSGSLVSQANKLIGAYQRFSDASVFNLYPLFVSLIATVAILAPRAPVFVVVLVVLALAYAAGTIFFSRAVREANAVESATQSRQTGYLADSMSNIGAIKTFSAAAYERARYLRQGNQVVATGLASMYATLKREGYASFFTTGIGIVALFVAVIGVGVLRADIATVFLMVSYTSNLGMRLWEFQNVLRQYNRALGDASDMVEILQIEPEIKDPARPERSRITAGTIAFEHVTFAHDESNGALFRDFNLEIKAGEKIGLVGRSGSGKTTFTRLLLRFSDLDAGRITIDGQDITSLTQDDLRRAISYVPQEPLLFHRSLRENIAYGKPKATQADILRTAEHAHAAEFVGKLPQGYDTLVGERGVKLSGGQRQRIAIARAMLKDAPILVLDEATSALDSESEQLIQDALWRLMEGRTAIVIAHRLSTIQRMDRIVVLDHGRIIEQGSHAQLLAAGGTYAQLWSHQSGGFIAEDEEPAEPNSEPEPTQPEPVSSAQTQTQSQ
jgi:ATP-binding cassette subfamily B protein